MFSFRFLYSYLLKNHLRNRVSFSLLVILYQFISIKRNDFDDEKGRTSEAWITSPSHRRAGLFRVHARGGSGRAGETRKQRGLLRLWIEYFIALLELRALLTWRRHTINLRARAVTHPPLWSCHEFLPRFLRFFFFFQSSLCKQVSLSHRPYHGSRFILNSSSEKLINYISFISKRSFAALMKFRWKIEDP